MTAITQFARAEAGTTLWPCQSPLQVLRVLLIVVPLTDIMEQLIEELNREIDSKGQLFVNQSMEALGDITSFVDAVCVLSIHLNPDF